MRAVPRPDELPPPVHMTGIGNSHIKITATPEAQVWFDQGLSLMHDFWDYEAAKAFEQGVRVDPNCAMCYWGLFKIEGFRGSLGRPYGLAALREASRLKKRTGKAEKLYIAAAEAQAAEEGGKDDDRPRDIPILRRLVTENPRDIEARIFLATELNDGFDDKGEPKAGTAEAISILEGVLRDAPNDSAANHYWIHAMEPGNHPERALNSAALLASLAPNSGHMVHMPGHIYYRVGDYAEAQRWFAASTEVDERYMREQHVGPDDDWNYVHNLMYAIADLIEQGKLAQANQLSDRLGSARGDLSTTLYIWSSRDQMARINNRLPVALRMGDWNSALKLLGADSVPEKNNTANLRFLAGELHDYASGMAALEQSDVPAAQAASEHMDAGLWRAHAMQKDPDVPAPDAKPDLNKAAKPPMMQIMPDSEAEPLMKALTIASLELRAGILVQQKNLEPAKKLYSEAIKREKDLGYREPPVYIRPVGETEGAALAKAGDYPGAKAAYEAALAERPRSGFGLYGLAHAEQMSGDVGAAQRDYSAFLSAWNGADPSLPELAQARKALEASAPRDTASK